MTFVYNDGGREVAGYTGTARDCVVRSIAIAEKLPYETVYKLLKNITRSSPRNGVNTKTKRFKAFMTGRGWTWIPTMKIGSGCKVHLVEGKLPMGTLIVSVSKHYTCVIDGVINDTFDPRRDMGRCVYGYWRK